MKKIVVVSDLQRYESKLVPDGDCIRFTGYHNRKGYAQFSVGRETVPAHRFAWTAARGAIPAGLTVDHTCENTWCQNVAHMELVTNAENIRRRDWRNGTCKRGHDVTVTAFSGGCRTCHNIRQREYKARKRVAA